MSDPKQRLIEIMSRLDPTFKYKSVLTEGKKTETNKPKLNEYHNYPAGSDDDPRAPWNDKPDAEWNGKIDITPSDSIEDFTITLYSNSPKASSSVSLYELVQKYSHGQDDYFLNAITMPNPERNPEFMNKIDQMLQQYANSEQFEWEYDEPEPNYGNY